MFIVLAELEDNLIIRDDSDNAVDVVPKMSVKTLLNFGVSISGAELSGSDLVVTPTMQYFAENFINGDSEDEDDEDEDDFYYGDFEDEEDEEVTDDSDDEEDDTYYDNDEDDYPDFEDDSEDDVVYYDDIEDDEDASTVAKLYSYLTPEQIKTLKRYYLWFSQRIFTDAQKDPTLGMKSQIALQRKKADLDQLRNTGGMWHYAGFVDMGYKGAGFCTLGHPLRYLHLAWDVTVSDIETAFFGENYDDDFEAAINSNNCIVFGIKCISDFFEVDKECMKALQKAQRDSLKDMALMYGYYESNKVDEINATFTMMDEVLERIKIKDTKGLLIDANYKPLVPLGLQNFYSQFRSLGMIPPKSMIQEIRDALIGWAGHKFIYERYNTEAKVLHMPSPERLKKIVLVLLTKFKSQGLIKALDSENVIYCRESSLEYYVYNFISVYLMYKICGHYEYNGDTQADEGGRNKRILEIHGNAIRRTKKYKGVSFDLASLEKLNNFMLGLLAYDEFSSSFKSPTSRFNSQTGLYEVDANSYYFDSAIISEYSQELSDAISFYNQVKGFRANRLFTSDIDENIALVLRHRTCLEENAGKFKQFALDRVQNVVDRLNAEKQSAIKAEEEAKAKLDSISSDKDIIAYLKDYDKSKVDTNKYAFAIKLVDQLSASGKEPSRNQMYYIGKMYTELTGKEYKPSGVVEKVLLADKPELEKALNYIVDNKVKCVDDRTFDIICSIVKYGSISEKQMKYAESGLETYKALGKE